MNITGKFVIFVEDKKGQKGDFKTFTTSVSTKGDNGAYTNATLEVRFAKENFPLERLNKMDSKYCYVYDVKESWLNARAYQTKDGKEGRAIYLTIKEAKPLERKEIVHKDARASLPEDLPF